MEDETRIYNSIDEGFCDWGCSNKLYDRIEQYIKDGTRVRVTFLSDICGLYIIYSEGKITKVDSCFGYIDGEPVFLEDIDKIEDVRQ